MHVTSQRKAVLQVRFGLGIFDLAGVDLRVEEREPPGDAVLFFFEQVQRHRSGMMRVQQASAFVAELIAIGGQGVPFRFVRCMEVIELADEHVAQRGDDVLGYLHPAVVILDLSLDSLDRHGLTDTVGALGVPASADEVRVDDTLAVLRVCDHESGATVSTVDRAFQVVLMYLGLLSGDLMCGEHVLHSLPEFCTYQWLVKTVVAGAAEDNVALVVRV